MIDILKQHAGSVFGRSASVAPQVQSTLAKLSVCRTLALGASWHWCTDCGNGIRIPNSCGDRHCPQCRGAQRATWVDRMQSLLLPDVDHYQVVFTIPDNLSSLTLGNRREMFNLLFRSAWQSLKTVIADEQQYEAAASMVLHTWNQKLDSHIHVHAVVPGGGPSLSHPGEWKKSQPPPHERSRRWWLVDADTLRLEFRTRFLAGLRQLHGKGKLKLENDWSHLRDPAAFEAFLAPLENKSWVTYIQPPPTTSSQPSDMVKYLARYLTGGPISDSRVVGYDGRNVTFTARTGTTHGGGDETENVQLTVAEFVRRWCLHILPHGYTKTRHYGGWSNYHRDRYLQEIRNALNLSDGNSDDRANDDPSVTDDDRDVFRRCPECGGELERLEMVLRTSWRDVFAFDSPDRPQWYEPWKSPG